MNIVCDKHPELSNVITGTVYVDTLDRLNKLLNENYKQMIYIKFNNNFIEEEFKNNHLYLHDYVFFVSSVFPSVKFDEDYGEILTLSKPIAEGLTKIRDFKDIVDLAYGSKGKFLRALRSFAETYTNLVNSSAEQSYSILSLQENLVNSKSIIVSKDIEIKQLQQNIVDLNSYLARVIDRLGLLGFTDDPDDKKVRPIKVNSNFVYFKIIEDIPYLTTFIKYLRLYLNTDNKSSRLVRIEPYNATAMVEKYKDCKYTNLTNEDILFSDLLLLGKNRNKLNYIAANGGGLNLNIIVDNSKDNYISFAGTNVHPIIITRNYVPSRLSVYKVIDDNSEDRLETIKNFENMDEIQKMRAIMSTPLAKEIIKTL